MRIVMRILKIALENVDLLLVLLWLYQAINILRFSCKIFLAFSSTDSFVSCVLKAFAVVLRFDPLMPLMALVFKVFSMLLRPFSTYVQIGGESVTWVKWKLGLLLGECRAKRHNQAKDWDKKGFISLAIVAPFLCWSGQKYTFDFGIYYYSNTLLLLSGEERIPSQFCPLQ